MSVTIQDLEIYDQLLADFQDDLRYIVRRFRQSCHALTEEEVVSETNKRLVKHKSKYINNNRDCLTKDGFAKFAYACAKNCVFWNMYGVTKRDQYKNKYVSTFSFSDPNSLDFGESEWNRELLNAARQESFLEDLCESNKINNIIKWIREYSDFLNDREIIVFNDYLAGKPQRETAETLNETRQSVSIVQLSIFEKIKANIKVKINQDNSLKRIKKGYIAINHLFK